MKIVLSGSRQKIYDVLQDSGSPLSAYDILAKLAAEGISGPPTVYRALKKLLSMGLVHRIESLNAYVACGRGGAGHAHTAQFAICNECESVTEMDDEKLHHAIHQWSDRTGFRIEQETVEVKGTCRKCRAA